MATQKPAANAMEIDRLATQLAKDPQSKSFLPLAEEYCKVGMWEEAVSVLEDGLKYYPGFITAMVVLGRAYDQLKQPTKARAVLEAAIKLSPENLRAHRTLIKIYAVHGLTREALKSCGVILAVNPKDEEALSVQASLEVQGPVQETQTASVPSPSKEPPPALPLASDHGRIKPSHDDASVEPQNTAPVTNDRPSETIASADSALRHADIIAQLESWLRSLQRQRRDRPKSEPTGSIP